MGNLQNKLISQTYDALIQTGTDEPIDGTLRPLQDGSGQNLPIEVSTTGVNFTGTVTGIPGGTDTTYTLDKSYIGSVLSFDLNGSDASTTSIALSPGTGIDLVATAAGARIDSTVTDTTYDLSVVDGTAPIPGNDAVDIKLTGSDATTDTVKLWAGDNIYMTRSGSNVEIGTASSVQNLNNLTGGLTLIGGTNVTITDNGVDNITIDAAGGGGGGLTGLSTTTLQVYPGPSTGDTAYYELTIPANTFTSGDIVQLSAIARQNFDGGGWIYDAAWISDSPQTGIGQYPIGGHANTGAPGAPFCVTWNKTIYIHTANGEGPTGGTTFYGDGSPIEQQTNGTIQYMDQYRIPINWTIPQYLTFTAYVDNAGSQIELAGVNLVKINA